MSWATDDDRLSGAASEAIADPRNEVLVSAASAWEIVTKPRLGKLDGVPGVVERLAELIAADGFRPLAIDQRHMLRAARWPARHRDPFDRMLAAQSEEIERVPLVTRDATFAQFGTQTFW